MSLDEIREALKNAKPATTKHELIGGTVFPVTYFDDGLVVIDYPDRLFCQQVKEKQKNENSCTGSSN